MEWMKKIKRFITQETKIDYDLETEEDYKLRWRSIRIIYFTMFLMSLGFSIVLTGIWPYLDKLDPSAGKIFLGYVVGANPLGQMLFSPLFGYWGNKINSIRQPLLSSLALFTFASLLYSSLELFKTNIKYWMLASRFLIGVSSANIAVCRSYLSAATTLNERTGAVSMVSLAQVLGFIVGPGLQAAVVPLGDEGVPFFTKALSINMYTAPGWINVFMGIANFIMFLPAIFQEKKIAAREAMRIHKKENEKETWKSIKPDYVSSWTLIIAFFVLVFNFVILETLGTTLTMEQFAWKKEHALKYMGILMSIGAVIACVTFVAINPLCKIFKEEEVLIWGGFSLMVIGRLLYIPWGPNPPKLAEVFNFTEFQNQPNRTEFDLRKMQDIINNDEKYLGCPKTQKWCEYTPEFTLTQFLVGFALTSVGYPIGVTLIQTIFSKILGPRPQGVWMGLMTGSGCFSRVLGPIFVSYIYTELGTVWTFGFTSIMMIVSMIWLWFFRKRLIPVNFKTQNENTEDGKVIKPESIELLEQNL